MTAYKAKTWDGSQWVDIGSNSIDSSTFASKSYVASTVPGRNLIINGAMQIAQRGTSVSGGTTSGYGTVDRFAALIATLGTWTQSVENDAPTGSGFRKSLKMLCTTADASPAAGDWLAIHQAIEGQNLQSVKKGTASAEQLTLSFWTKSNKTGVYTVRLADLDNTRAVSASYTVSASATWEKKTITFPADTTGAFDNDSAASLSVQFQLAAGSNYTSSPLSTIWETTADAKSAAGQVNLASDVNNYWQITGVQLEIGSAATGFQFKDFGQELAECQRYYYHHVTGTSAAVGLGIAVTTTRLDAHVSFPVTMRIAPALAQGSGTGYFAARTGSADLTVDSWSMVYSQPNAAQIYGTLSSTTTAGYGARVYTANAAAYLGFSADL